MALFSRPLFPTVYAQLTSFRASGAVVAHSAGAVIRDRRRCGLAVAAGCAHVLVSGNIQD
jgi:hypothetical protein